LLVHGDAVVGLLVPVEIFEFDIADVGDPQGSLSAIDIPMLRSDADPHAGGRAFSRCKTLLGADDVDGDLRAARGRAMAGSGSRTPGLNGTDI
jgi:hypothetical protein